MPNSKLTTIEIEVALAQYFNPRQNLIVPNVCWGMHLHECDLLIITKASYAYEVEIKISKSDRIKDKEKWHKHDSDKIKYLYFAIPVGLVKHIDYIPSRAGIITVEKHGKYYSCRKIREPKIHSKYAFTDKERLSVLRLGAMRMWTLKKKIIKLQEEIK